MEPPIAKETSRSLARSSAHGFLWNGLAWGSNRIILLALTLVLARLLTPQDFGVVTAAVTIIAMLDAALDLGVGASVVADQQRGITHRIRTAFSLNVAVSTGVAALGVLLSPLIAGVFDAREHAGLFALIFLYPLFRGCGQVNDAVLKRDLRFRRRTVIGLLRAVVRVAVTLPLALTIGGAISIAIGIVVSEFVAMVVLWLLVPVRPTTRIGWSTVSELLRFGGQVAVIRMLGSFRGYFDYFVVGAMISTTALGFYGMAYKLPELIIENMLWIFSGLALSTYSRARDVGQEVMHQAMLRATRLLALYGLAAGTALAVVARDAVPVLFSEQWNEAVVPMMLISISLGVMSIAWASGDVFAAMGRPGTLIMLELPATVLMISAFLFSAQYGLIGVASVHLVFNIVHCVLRLVLLSRLTKVSGQAVVMAVLPGVLVASTTAVVGFGVRSLLPSGELASLVVLSAVCAVTVIGATMIFARPAVTDVRDALGSRRRGTGPAAAEPTAPPESPQEDKL